MQFGTSIALFLVLAIVLLALFCLITKYFQYRMNKKAQQQGQEFSQVDEMTQNSDQDVQGQYEEFLEKRKTREQSRIDPKRNREQAYLFEKTEVEQPINNSNDPIYGVSMLRKRLQGESVLQQLPDQTGRSLGSVKSFRPQRLQTGRSGLSSNRGLVNSNLTTQQLPLIKHEYISRLICYNQQGIFITNVTVLTLTRQHSHIKQKKTINTTIINPMQLGFQDQLQVLGFEARLYSCMKFKIMAEIPHMVENQEYPVNALKVSESKEEIDFSEYYLLKDKIESSLE